VLHKTSRFDRNELDGFHKAIDERDIDYADFVWIQNSMTRLYRLGVYPPLRGSLLRFSKDQALLYTRGSVDGEKRPGESKTMPETLTADTRFGRKAPEILSF
jgi:hypothetical protein